MQSLQMRWPVAAAIGLSMVTTASAPMELPLLLHRVHLGDFLFERAAGQLDAEDAGFEGAVLFAQARGATVLALVVALDAVMRVVERAGQVRAGIGQLEAFALTPVIGGELDLDEAVVRDLFRRNEVVHVELVRRLKEDARAMLSLCLPASAWPMRHRARRRAEARRARLRRASSGPRDSAKLRSVSGSSMNLSSSAAAASHRLPRLFRAFVR